MIAQQDTKAWGPWVLTKDSMDLRLITKDGREVCWVSLANFVTSARTLDMIAQVATKEGRDWEPHVEVLGHFVLALCEILEPQSRLCSAGEERGPIATTEAAWWAKRTYKRLNP